MISNKYWIKKIVKIIYNINLIKTILLITNIKYHNQLLYKYK